MDINMKFCCEILPFNLYHQPTELYSLNIFEHTFFEKSKNSRWRILNTTNTDVFILWKMRLSEENTKRVLQTGQPLNFILHRNCTRLYNKWANKKKDQPMSNLRIFEPPTAGRTPPLYNKQHKKQQQQQMLSMQWTLMGWPKARHQQACSSPSRWTKIGQFACAQAFW